MKLEAIIICVNYADFLAHTLPTNKQFFDKVVVVTDSKDIRTKNLCDYYHVECVVTDIFYEDGGVFNKARGINEGLKKLDLSDWVIQMDADIYLPPLTRIILERLNKHLLKDSMYSIDRMMCPTYEAWQDHISNPNQTHTGWIYVHPTVFEMGVRIAEYMEDGYEPIGYFQMWNPNVSNVHQYPIYGVGADRTDVLHSKSFPRSKRILLPELICIHLDSENLNLKDMGKNWYGRKTAEFAQAKKIEKPEENIKLSSSVQETKNPIVTPGYKHHHKKRKEHWIIWLQIIFNKL